MTRFATRQLGERPDAIAPDGSEVRLLAVTERGSMAHFRLSPGSVSRAVVHGTVEEIWFFVAGRGEMWRHDGEREETVAVAAGISISLPVGTRFQFRAAPDSHLEAVGVTMPPWPGAHEAAFVDGVWEPTG